MDNNIIESFQQKEDLFENNDDSLISQTNFPLQSGIPKNLVIASKVDLEHVICPICLNILWQPICCAQEKCYSSFCSPCINLWLQQSESEDNNSEEEDDDMEFFGEIGYSNHKNCPKCKRKFKKTTLPLVNSLLSGVKLYCLFKQFGCQEKIDYDFFEKHCQKCNFKNIQCEGCNELFLQKDYDEHQQNCQKITVKCQKCNVQLQRQEFELKHQKIECYENQLQKKDEKIQKLENDVENLKQRIQTIEQKFSMIIRGEMEEVSHYEFQTVFVQNFQFNQKDVKLVQASWNQYKNKLDFLHFYLRKSVRTQGLLGVQWKVKIHTLQGNLLIGICSNLNHHSVDYILNKYGEMKKKEANDNKYKFIRKVNFQFNQGDTLIFTYYPLQMTMKIDNEGKHCNCTFEKSEIMEMGENFFNFFSMDYENDYLKFL